MRYIHRHSSLLLLILVNACSLVPGGDNVEAAASAIIDTGISDRISYNDQKAEILLALPCDISLGAYYRLTNNIQQEALVMLCSGRYVGQPAPALGPGSDSYQVNSGTR